MLDFSAAAAEALSSAELLQRFCSSTRAYFQVSGIYLWQFLPPDQLWGAEADGWMAEHFRNRRLRTADSAIAHETIHQKKPMYLNALRSAEYPLTAEFNLRSIMAVPLIVSGEVLGAAVFGHNSEPYFFTDDHVAKATIIVAQMGGFFEAIRRSEAGREEQRRAGILAEVAQSLHSEPDVGVLVEAVANRLRVLLRTPLICVLVRESSGYELWAIATENPAAAISIRSRYDRKDLHFAADLARRAVLAGVPISVSIDPGSHSLGDLVPPGALLAAPFRTSSKEGAVLVYPRRQGPFTAEERSLLPVVTSFAALAISNAELYSKARAQAHELHQIVSIASELASVADLDQFMEKFLLRASDFLGFARSFLGLMDHDKVQLRWTYGGKPEADGSSIPESLLADAVTRQEILCVDDRSRGSGGDQEILAAFNVRQFVAVPLVGTSGERLGLFGLMERVDGSPISAEDIRRAKALAAEVTVALEVSRNLLLSEILRKKTEALTHLALEMHSLLRRPDSARGFVARAAEMMEVTSAALVIE
ncbi:MAG: GAF domain-containing protein, partial [Acidobacteria bacterium]|nr:GAF domain-containing protein [Acidobacteriota bacterium]